MNSEHRKTAKADFISSLIICLFSVVIFIYSLIMPQFKEWGTYATPALAPIVFSVILFVVSGIVLIRSIRYEGYKIAVNKEQVLTFVKSPIFINFTVSTALVFLYYIFFGVLHFIVISSIYVVANILFHAATKWWKAVILGVVYTAVIYLLFNYVFFIPVS